jgi:hypothetical protein
VKAAFVFSASVRARDSVCSPLLRRRLEAEHDQGQQQQAQHARQDPLCAVEPQPRPRRVRLSHQ